MINETKFLYINNQFPEEPWRWIIKTDNGDELKIPLKISNFQPNVERAAEELKSKKISKRKERELSQETRNNE